jgi:peptidoglycan/LPS O-acetylase OafA/YrhL
VWRLGMLAMGVACAGRAAALATGHDWTAWFSVPPLRWDGLIVGSLAALAVHGKLDYARARPLLWGTAGIGAGAMGLLAWHGYGTRIFKAGASPFDVALTAGLPTVMSLTFGAILLIALQANPLSRFLGQRIFQPLALYSYGAYIAHFMLLPTFQRAFGPQVLQQWIGGRDAPVYAFFLGSSALSFAVAMLSYHLFEVHFLRLKESAPRTRVAII